MGVVTAATRQISIDAIRDAAAFVYRAAIRTPLIRVDIPDVPAGVPCSVMIMDTAPAAKVDAINRLGASIVRVTYDEAWRTVERHGSDRMRGYFIHPFDDDRFIAGNATAALEILEDLPDVDAIVGSVGGGGLLAGVISTVCALRPQTRVFAAEPETAAPLAASLAAGRPVYFDQW